MAKYETFLKDIIPILDQSEDAHIKYKNRKIEWEEYEHVIKQISEVQTVRNLEGFVKTRFKKLLKKINTPCIKILDFDTKYNGFTRRFEIKVTKLQFSDGNIIDNSSLNISRLCPCVYMKIFNGNELQVNPGVKDFMKNYYINRIINPDHYC